MIRGFHHQRWSGIVLTLSIIGIEYLEAVEQRVVAFVGTPEDLKLTLLDARCIDSQQVFVMEHCYCCSDIILKVCVVHNGLGLLNHHPLPWLCGRWVVFEDLEGHISSLSQFTVQSLISVILLVSPGTSSATSGPSPETWVGPPPTKG